jgi:hypothetical protein
MAIERWVIVRPDGALILHEENDGAAFLRHGPQAMERFLAAQMKKKLTSGLP